MAIRKLRSTRLDSRRENQIRKAIVAELRRPDDAPASPEGPVVYQEESGTPERYTRWYVIWKKFEGVDSENRSRVVLEAVEEVFGRQAALRVSIAMGLTPEDPVAQDIAEHSVIPSPAQACASVAESHVDYGKTKRARHATKADGSTCDPRLGRRTKGLS
jgi:hypothetical protein